MKEKNSTSNHTYKPNLGFIGNKEVKVTNYLFSSRKPGSAYQHTKTAVANVNNCTVEDHFNESKELTDFLKYRDLTFSKKTKNGSYKSFVVPCTTTIVPLQKSMFNKIEVAGQKLVISLRKVLQDIYGAKDLKSSKFIQSLPSDIKDIFIDAINHSPSYIPQLHHKNMKYYPFMDNIGLDLVLIEDYLNEDLPNRLRENETDTLELPFRILEINAGSPSGASNNMNMLEGLNEVTPKKLKNLGRTFENDHFKVLGETYKSLGKDWTGIEDGIQIILPPGGENGAAPEIHQLAAFSGLTYADPNQLFQDDKGYIRLRTVGNNPIVTAIYSRVNADAALFDESQDITLKDPDSGEIFYLQDAFKTTKNGNPILIKDEDGNPIPLHSAFQIPGALNAIITKKLYMGGLNRIMDNKIILATLTHYAPLYFEKEIEKLGVSLKSASLQPPATLPPTKKSVQMIISNPDEWVVKAPDSAGGNLT